MIKAWRAAFEDSQLAFGMISLCTSGSQTSDDYLEQMLDAGAHVRESQYKTFLAAAMAVTKTSDSPAATTCEGDGIIRG